MRVTYIYKKRLECHVSTDGDANTLQRGNSTADIKVGRKSQRPL